MRSSAFTSALVGGISQRTRRGADFILSPTKERTERKVCLISIFQQRVDTALIIPGLAGAHFLVFVHDQNQCIRFIAAVLKTLYVCVYFWPLN